MKCLVCQKETSRNDTMIIAFGYNMKVCVSCDDWLLTLERVVITHDENEFIICSVFEYVQQANDRYLEYTRWPSPAIETERSLHYKDIIDTGNALLVKLAGNGGEIEYNMAEYIKMLSTTNTPPTE